MQVKLKYIWIIALLFCGEQFAVAQQQYVNVMDEGVSGLSQYTEQSLDSIGAVQIYADERLSTLLEVDRNISSRNPGFEGYRIQIFSGQSVDKEKALAERERFQNLYPGVRVYVVYKAPDFRVMVGNFRTKLEAIPLYKIIQKEFPNCYPVKTKINFVDLEPLPEMQGEYQIENAEQEQE